MSIAEFDSLTPPEFEMIVKHYYNTIETSFKNDWERARFISLYSLAPHSKRALKPKDICIFEWEKHGDEFKELTAKDMNKIRERAKELEKKWQVTPLQP